MSFKERFYYYFYSNKNLAGMVAAGVGLAAYGIGVIDSFWYFIIPGLYAAMALGWPSDSNNQLQLEQDVTVEAIKNSLNSLVRKISRKVPKEVLAKVKSIKESIFIILPYIADINSADSHIFSIRQTALEYLPESLEHYLNLPTAYARFHTIRDGKTATDLLMEQLDLLDKEMKEIVIDFSSNNTQNLEAHGRFLKDKFRKEEILTLSRPG